MLPEWLVLFINVRSGDLECHVLIRHFGDGGYEENCCQYEDENTNGKVHPLHAFQSVDGVIRIGEKHVRGKGGRDDCADSIECLG
jgi:hypothetical protein